MSCINPHTAAAAQCTPWPCFNSNFCFPQWGWNFCSCSHSSGRTSLSHLHTPIISRVK